MLTSPSWEAGSTESLAHDNLPNQTNNFSFLGRASKAVELKVRAHFLAQPPRKEGWLVGVPSSVEGDAERGGKRFPVPLHYYVKG